MSGALIRYIFSAASMAFRNWNQFWFALAPTSDIGWTRVALGIFGAIYAISWIFNLHDWIQADGRLNVSMTRYLIGDQLDGTGSAGRVSLLYLIESKGLIQGYLIAASFGSLAMALGIGGRIMAAFAWMLTLGIVHRVPMLQGAGDLLATGILGYLIIDPGKTKNWWRIGLDDRTLRWTSNLALRLMQCHVLIWLMVSFVSHLAETMWWSGNAIWWLASAQLSPWFSAYFLSDKPYFINAISHGFLILHLVTIVLLLIPNYRPMALLSSSLMAIGVWGLTGDWIYAIALILCTSPFWGVAIRELQQQESEVRESAASELNDSVKEFAIQPSVKKKPDVRHAVLKNRSRGST